MEVKPDCPRVPLRLPPRTGFPANCSRKVAQCHSEVNGSPFLTTDAHTFGLSARTMFRCECQPHDIGGRSIGPCRKRICPNCPARTYRPGCFVRSTQAKWPSQCRTEPTGGHFPRCNLRHT